MLKTALRFFALLLLVIIIIMDDFPFYAKMKDATTQLFLALFVIWCIYFDTTLGFILGLVLMVIYYEIYKKIKKNVNLNNDYSTYFVENMTENKETEIIDTSIQQPHKSSSEEVVKLNYISEEHLLAAQNNIFDHDNYSTEVTGMKDETNNKQVYGAQGLDKNNVNFVGYIKHYYYSL